MHDTVSHPTSESLTGPRVQDEDTQGYVWSPPGAPFEGCIPPFIFIPITPFPFPSPTPSGSILTPATASAGLSPF